MDGKDILLKMSRENYAYWFIQDIIDKEIRAAFRIRER
jgi:hypothetical protein